jgi:hypothetical protein
MVPIYALIAVPPSLIGVAAVVAVVRASREDLPAIVRALMRIGPPDYDNEKGASLLPKHTASESLTRRTPGRRTALSGRGYPSERQGRRDVPHGLAQGSLDSLPCRS